MLGMENTTHTDQAQTYQGWTNYETWAVNLWLSNDEGLYSETREMAQQAIQDAPEHHNTGNVWTEAETARFTLADSLKDWFEELAPELEGVFADLLNAALSEVNWEEVAQSWIDSERES